jgi:hypothetical protein
MKKRRKGKSLQKRRRKKKMVDLGLAQGESLTGLTFLNLGI